MLEKNKLEAYYGLPNEVKFCTKCVMSNQRPTSSIEFKHTKESKKTTMNFDDDGVCDACRTHIIKENIDWGMREDELIKLLDKHRKNDGSYDCLVPGSGGKDSAYQAHVLKYKYNMNPLTVTWPPILYTDYGLKNWKNWLDAGFDNISFYRNGKVMKLLTRLSIENLLHPFQTFILGQKNLAPKIAAQHGINLVFYGENEAEYGNPLADNTSSLRDKSYFSFDNLDEVFLAGVSIKELMAKYDVRLSDLMSFLPPKIEDLEKANIEVHYLGYYLKWTPQEVYYYAVENTGFKARPHRTQGTFSKYSGIDDKIDDLHFYTTFIKFGIGRTTYDASQEIRNNHITRDGAKVLAHRFEGEFPDKYFSEVIEYLKIKEKTFFKWCDDFRSPHLWTKKKGKWKLRHNVNKTGEDD
jgi:N-acetyl sugar amidotransferase